MESRQPRVLVVDDEQHIVDFVEPAGRRGNLLGLLDRTTSSLPAEWMSAVQMGYNWWPYTRYRRDFYQGELRAIGWLCSGQDYSKPDGRK